ncbi:MAG: carbon-nitrogen hydrolase family protein [Rhodothermales bacterium]|nr:carbon-nitrogen hydrolase family protein [Rhodothermales bacterium]
MSVIKAALVQLWSTPEHSADENRKHCLEMAEVAASSKPDIVLLPEAVAMLCMPDRKKDFTYRDVCEPVPGPTTEALAELARSYNTNIVCGLIQERQASCQNVAVVIDRQGSMVGMYEKLHEPEICRTEQLASTGSDIPVFDLDFGRVGIMICWDLISPEIAAIIALKGADVILFPHLIGLPIADNFSIRLRSRAIDAGLPVLASGMRDNSSHTGHQDGLYPTCAIDSTGSLIAQTEHSGADVLLVDLDLGESGTEASHKAAARDRRPDVYSAEYHALTRGTRTR